MVIVTHLPDDSATKTAMREGDWSEAEYMSAFTVNQLLLVRADLRGMFGGQQWSPPLVKSPQQRIADEANRQKASSWNAHVTAQMRNAQLALEGR